MTPEVSVVIASHNRASTVVRAVVSVLRQTFTGFELLVVDDGSTDDSVALIESIDDPRIHVFRSPCNEGVSSARNRGIRNARGKWVAFQDSDDEWLPDKLEKQLDAIAKAGPDCVGAYCGLLILGEPEPSSDSRTTVRYIPDPTIDPVDGEILSSLLRTSFVSTQTMVVRRDVLADVDGFDENLRALVDWDCALRIARVGPLAFVDEPLAIQRFSFDSLTRNAHRRVLSTARVVEKNMDLLSARPDILNHHYRVIAGGYRRLGDYATAALYSAQARRLKPLDWGTWANWAHIQVSRAVRAGTDLFGGRTDEEAGVHDARRHTRG